MNDLFLWQSAILFWISVCFFRVGAHVNRVRINRRAWWEIAQAGAVVVLLFAVITSGRGCSTLGSLMPDSDAICVGDAAC